MTVWTTVRRMLVVALLATMAFGCDASLEPFAETERAFTLLGYLDSDADTQFVRVVPLRRVVDRRQPVPIDATVRSLDLTTGEEVVWQDSLLRFADSTYGHIFWASFRPQPTHRYRLEVRRSDGAVSQAETTLPPIPDTSAVYTLDNRSTFFQPLVWPGVHTVIDVDVRYRVNAKPGGIYPPPDPPPSTATEVRIRYEQDDRGSRQGDAWWTEFNLVEDLPLVREALRAEGRSSDLILLYSLSMRIAIPGEGWAPPDGIWDRDVLVQPGTFSNVDGGLGFWGAVTRVRVSYNLDQRTMNTLGYAAYTPRDGSHHND